MRQTWFRLKSKDGSIDMMFSDYDVMMRYYKTLPIDKALQCSWDVHWEE